MSLFEQVLAQTKVFLQENFEEDDFVYQKRKKTKRAKKNPEAFAKPLQKQVPVAAPALSPAKPLRAKKEHSAQKTLKETPKNSWQLKNSSIKEPSLEAMKAFVKDICPDAKILELPKEKKPFPFLIKAAKQDPFIKELKIAIEIELAPVVFCEHLKEFCAFEKSHLALVHETCQTDATKEHFAKKLVVIKDSSYYQENPKHKAALWQEIIHATKI